MDPLALALFAGVYFAAVASPGPGIAAVVARVMARGLAGAPAFVLGFVVGDLIWFTIAATGLAVIARNFEMLFLAIKYVGAAYLLYLAWRIWTAPVTTTEIAADPSVKGQVAAFFGGLMVTLGNPKVIVFFLSIMPIVVDLQAITPEIFAQMALVIACVIGPVMMGYALLAERARRLFHSARALKNINRGTAAIMAGAAALIAAR